MKFLIDECLTVKLASLAFKAQHEAYHVARIGKRSEKDWKLAPYAIENDYVVVTCNSKDFRGEDGRPRFITQEEVHPDLICLNAREMDGELMELLVQQA